VRSSTFSRARGAFLLHVGEYLAELLLPRLPGVVETLAFFATRVLGEHAGIDVAGGSQQRLDLGVQADPLPLHRKLLQ